MYKLTLNPNLNLFRHFFDLFSDDGIIITLILLVKQLFKAFLSKIFFKTIVKSTVLC